MSKLTFAVVALLGCCLIPSAVADEPTKQPKPKQNIVASVGMQIKLKMAKEILAGLATEDFEKILKNAKGMKTLNLIEHVARSDAKAYQTQLRIFQFSTDELVRCSKEENLEGATLAYTTMATSCVGCHKQLRKDE